jgi:hypothetical protein
MELHQSKTIWLIRATLRSRTGCCRRCIIRIDFVQAKLCQQGGVYCSGFRRFTPY